MDALDLLTGDHRTAQNLFDQYDAATTPNERRGLIYAITDQLSRHTMVEKHMLYPLVTRVRFAHTVPAPSPWCDVHEEMRDLLAVLPQAASHDHSATAKLMATLCHDFRLHSEFDEEYLHPLLRDALDRPARDELGWLLMEGKGLPAELSSQSQLENRPTNLAVAIGTFCDRLRDRLGDRSPV